MPASTARVMGIVNVTPDSFSDGGRYTSAAGAIAHALRLVGEGADLLDIGGESTRPGAAPVDADEELRRVIPVVEGLLRCGVPLSVDTCKPEVMSRAIAAGADMINDVGALRAAGALEAVAPSAAAVCLMHMRGEPRTMQMAPEYRDVVGEVGSFLAERVSAAEAAGIARSRIVADPGFGFGKTVAHNLALLRRLDAFAALGVPLLVGLSRKSMFRAIAGLEVQDRLIPSVAAAVVAAMKGARILRVHDVEETKLALRVVGALESERGKGER